MSAVEKAKEFLKREAAQPKRINYDAYRDELLGIFRALVGAEMIIRDWFGPNSSGSLPVDKEREWLSTYGEKK